MVSGFRSISSLSASHLQRPEPFYWLLQQYFPKEFRPTLTHSFFHLLDRKGLLLRVYTQNVDCLELLGGLDSDRLIQVHGKLCDAHCVGCHKQVSTAPPSIRTIMP